MKNLNSREVLEKNIFFDYILNDNNIKNMEKILIALKPKILPQKLAKLFNSQLDIDNFNDDELYFMTKYFHLVSKDTKEIKVDKISPEKFFTNPEIKNYDEMDDIDYSVELDNHMLIPNVTEIKEDREWRSPKVSIQDLKSFVDKNLVTYDPKMQRPSDKKIVRGQVREVISTNKKSINEIKNLIIKGDYFPPTITFNIVSNGNEKFNFENNMLGITVEGGCEVAILDGWHNLSALIKALRVNPNIDLDFKVDIYRVDENTARDFIAMRNKQTPFKMETESYYDTSKVENLLANDINTEGTNNQMKNKIGKESNDIKLLNDYCTFKTLSTAIKDNFELDKKNVKKTRDIKLYLIEYFNEIVGSIFNKEFEDVKASRMQGSLITTNNTFYGYVALASVLYKQDNWKENKWQDKLLTALSFVDFSKDNSCWRGKGMTIKDIAGKQKGQLYDYFKGLAKENITNTEEVS